MPSCILLVVLAIRRSRNRWVRVALGQLYSPKPILRTVEKQENWCQEDYKVIAAGPNEQNLKQHVGSWVIVTINGTGGGPS